MRDQCDVMLRCSHVGVRACHNSCAGFFIAIGQMASLSRIVFHWNLTQPVVC
jgi:hypothetical protein